VTFEGKWPAGPECGKQFFGILVGGKANLILIKSKLLHAGAEPINGCQQGVGVQVGHNFNSQVGTATLSKDLIEGYQKNGITVDGPGSKAIINKGTIVKSVPTSEIGQNGIQVSRGAVGNITDSTIEGNQCNAASCGFSTSFSPFAEEEDATGVLFYLSAKGSSVSASTLKENDIGIYNLSKEETGTPQTTLNGDKLEANRYWGIALDQGFATLSKDSIKGSGNVGIQAVQYDEPHQGLAKQEFGPKGTGHEDTVEGMSVCAVEGLSDNGASDQFGSVNLTSSLVKFASNAATVCNNNTTGKLVISVK
jgi:hypothetical protein